MDAADQVLPERDHAVSRNREIAERQPLLGLEADLLRRQRNVGGEPLDYGVGRVAEFADVEVFDIRIHLGRGRYRGAAQHHRLARGLGPFVDVADLRSLHVHATDQHGIGPGEILRFGARDVLIDETDRPAFRQAASTSRPCGGMKARTL